MIWKIGIFKTLIFGIGLTLPLHAQAVAELARQIRADVAVMSSQPTMAAWEASRPGGKIELAHYDMDKDVYRVGSNGLNRWCTASVASLSTQTMRAALFYIPPVVPGSLPSFSKAGKSATILACHMQAIWYETRSSTWVDALVRELSPFWGQPNGPSILPDVSGSARWKDAAAWHRNGMNIWIAYDSHGAPGGAYGPSMIVYARRDIVRDELNPSVGSFDDAVRDQIIDAAAHMAGESPSLTAGVLERSQCLTKSPPREPDSVIGHRLVQWLKNSAKSPSAQRAAALLVADAYVRCGPLSSDDLVRLGGKLTVQCPQDGPVYDGNFLVEAEEIEAKGSASELAGLMRLGQPCELKGEGAWPDRVIAEGEKMLRKYPTDQWTPWIHFAIASAHAATLSFAYPGGDPEWSLPPNTLSASAMQRHRQAAVVHFKDFIHARPDVAESIFAWQEVWRLLAGLPPSHVQFGCDCE